MRFFQPPADIRFYAGVDLQARSLFIRSVLRRSPHACWVRRVLGPRGRESRPRRIETTGSPTNSLRRRCHDPGAKASKKR
jgi:hypothetical protein